MSSRTILVVEDDEQLRVFVTRVATRNGFRVLPAETPDAAMSLARMQSPDLIISDVLLPSMRGIELVQALRKGGYDGPVLFISGDSSLATVGDSLASPGAMFLPKPFSARELSEAIDGALRST